MKIGYHILTTVYFVVDDIFNETNANDIEIFAIRKNIFFDQPAPCMGQVGQVAGAGWSHNIKTLSNNINQLQLKDNICCHSETWYL